MPRPRLCRWVRFQPRSKFFKPSGIPLKFLDEISLSIDELEAIRLADFEGFFRMKQPNEWGYHARPLEECSPWHIEK